MPKRNCLEKLNANEEKEDKQTMQVRYMLFYADDVVTNGIQSKVQAQYSKKLDKDDNIIIDPTTQNNLVEEGYYFSNLLVSPRSPKKIPMEEHDEVTHLLESSESRDEYPEYRPVLSKPLELNVSPTFNLDETSEDKSP